MSKNVIIYVSTNIKKDGAEKSLVSLQKYIKENKGIDTLTIIPKHGPIVELLEAGNVPYIIHRFEGNVNYNRGTKYLRGIAKCSINIVQAYVLARKLKKMDMNICGIHSNTITSEFGQYLADFLNVPHIWHVREFGKLDFGFDFELGFQYIKKCTKRAEKVVCNSKAVMDYYSNYLCKENLTYIYNGVTMQPKGDNNWDADQFRMILIGRLSSEKGQNFAIEACHELLNSGYDNFCLDLYGEGADREKYEQLVHQYNLDNHVRFMGYCSNIPINTYHLGLMCSHHEAFGRVTVEYMINGLPVIGVNSGGTAEILENDSTGYLIQTGDVRALVDRMKDLYLNRQTCKDMGTRGKQRALSLFAESRYCEEVYDLYQTCYKI